MNDSELKSVLHYEPENGLFTWLVGGINNINIGDVAGTIDSGYRRIGINRRVYRAHRLAFLYMTGEWPKHVVDHINGVKDDNRWCNLRSVTAIDNNRNAKKRKDNTSGVQGVTRHTRASWRFKIGKTGNGLNRLFSDSKFGGTDLALMAASFYAARMYSEFGYHENHGRIYDSHIYALLKARSSHALQVAV